jgi:hypothetical protein
VWSVPPMAKESSISSRTTPRNDADNNYEEMKRTKLCSSFRLLCFFVVFISRGGVKMRSSGNWSSAFNRLSWLIITMLFAALSGGYLVAAADDCFRKIVSCESIHYRKTWCRVDTRGGVRLFKQKSKSPCIRGKTWGFNRHGIWVDNGCRAKFKVGRCEWDPESEPGVKIVSCDSKHYRKNWCRVDTRGGVRLVKEKSKSPCIRGKTWGFTRHAIWVDCGCRAKFKVGRCAWCL